MAEHAVHPIAEVFGDVADEYERGRPGYPPAAVEYLLDAAGLGPESRVLDVGAGSGKLTRDLSGRVASVVAIEPSAGMREALARALPAVDVRPGTAEALDLPGGEFDAVVAAQAFHWFDAPAALEEFHRVLRPSGVLGLLWNIRDRSNSLNRDVSAVIDAHYGDIPRHYRTDWEGVIEATGHFTGTTKATFPHSQSLDEKAFLSRFMSVSWVASQPAGERGDISASLGAVHRVHAAGGHATVHYATHIYVSRRT